MDLAPGAHVLDLGCGTGVVTRALAGRVGRVTGVDQSPVMIEAARRLGGTVTPLVARAGLQPADRVEAWLAEQREADQEGVFFAACSYYAYLARR
jgi:predicted TPR repeat methyltransferase